MKTVFIYTLNDPVSGLVRYVGKANNPHKRLGEHLSEAKKARCYRSKWIQSLVSAGLYPVLSVLDEVQEDQWQALEAAYIQFFKEEGCKLVNGTDGGDTGPTPDAKHKQKLREQMLGERNHRFGKPWSVEMRKVMEKKWADGWRPRNGTRHTAESREKMRLAKLGSKQTPEHSAAIGAANLGRKHSAEFCEKSRLNNLGRKASPEARANMRAARLRYFARKAAAKLAAQLLPPSYADNPS